LINFFLEKENYQEHKQITRSKKIYFLGGTIFFIGILIFYNLSKITLFGFLMYSLGLLSDKNKLSSPIIRFLIQLFIIILTVISCEIYINSTKIIILDELLRYNNINIFFSSFCLIVLINGSNFIDGVNLNLIGYYLLVLLVLLILSLNLDLKINFYFLYFMISTLTIIFILNFTGKIVSGDSGAYIYSFVIGIFIIQFSNENKFISPLFFAVLLWYPVFENLFSILRKKQINISPLKPDFKHLHQLIYEKIKIKLIKSESLSNNVAGLIILMYNALIFLFSLNFINNTQILLMIIILNIIVYVKTYFSLNYTIKN
tara:strand:- start:1664 stop:2611 length:948 start_codon:yes stop_codon:yes gene_type:complete